MVVKHSQYYSASEVLEFCANGVYNHFKVICLITYVQGFKTPRSSCLGYFNSRKVVVNLYVVLYHLLMISRIAQKNTRRPHNFQYSFSI